GRPSFSSSLPQTRGVERRDGAKRVLSALKARNAPLRSGALAPFGAPRRLIECFRFCFWIRGLAEITTQNVPVVSRMGGQSPPISSQHIGRPHQRATR